MPYRLVTASNLEVAADIICRMLQRIVRRTEEPTRFNSNLATLGNKGLPLKLLLCHHYIMVRRRHATLDLRRCGYVGDGRQ